MRYLWQKPSSQQTVPKLAYVMTLPGWEWVIGTGLYLDDVHDTLRRIDLRAQENIDGTRRRIYGIAALCIVLIGLAGLALNLSDHRVASAKLRRLAQRVVRSQEEERVRVARELHDGVVQVLVSSSSCSRPPRCSGPRARPPGRTTCWTRAWTGSTMRCWRSAASRTACAPPCWTTWAWRRRWPSWRSRCRTTPACPCGSCCAARRTRCPPATAPRCSAWRRRH